MQCNFEFSGRVAICSRCGLRVNLPESRRRNIVSQCNLERAMQAPSLARKMVNYTAAAAKHAAAGFPKASAADVAARWEVCQMNRCGYFALIKPDVAQCKNGGCGCTLRPQPGTGRNKLQWADQTCPVNLWGAVSAEKT